MSDYTVITLVRRGKLAQASAGIIELPVIEGMAFGNGGLDENGDVIVPDETQSSLNSELHRQENSEYSVESDTVIRYTCVLDEDTLNGEEISEVALYDSDGDLVCIHNMSAKGKDEGETMSFIIDDEF